MLNKKRIIIFTLSLFLVLSNISLNVSANDASNNEVYSTEIQDTIKVVIWAKYEDISSYAEEEAYRMTADYVDTLDTVEYTYREIEKMKADYYKEKKRELLKQAFSERAELILAELEVDKKQASYSSFTPMIVCNLNEEQMKKAETLELVSSVSLYEPMDDAQNATTIDISALIGDINLDNIVTISDSVLILQHLSNSEKYPLSEQATMNADCYDPGSGITGLDAAAIQKLDAGIIDKLPETIN